jgi:hypothetical protein
MTTWNDEMVLPEDNHWGTPAREEVKRRVEDAAKRYISGLISYDEDVPSTLTITTELSGISPELRKLLIGDD